MHAIGDFFFQGSKLSKLKALKLAQLFEHVGIYTAVFVVLSPLLLGLTFIDALIYSFINGVLHFVIDYFTGVYKVKYFQKNDSKYLSVIGIDHTLHILILIATYIYIFPYAINAYTLWHFTNY